MGMAILLSRIHKDNVSRLRHHLKIDLTIKDDDKELLKLNLNSNYTRLHSVRVTWFSAVVKSGWGPFVFRHCDLTVAAHILT